MPIGFTLMRYRKPVPIGLVFEFWNMPKWNDTLLRIEVMIV